MRFMPEPMRAQAGPASPGRPRGPACSEGLARLQWRHNKYSETTPMPRSTLGAPAALPATLLALALSLGAAVSLGITRFAYGLLLPTMREDLGWSYALAGAMNTANALGYLLGALATPWLLRRQGPERVLLGGAVLASLFMACSGFFTEAAPLLVQRLLAGAASALVFIAGGLMAARLGALQPGRSGWLLGLYYGGTGWGLALGLVGAGGGQPAGQCGAVVAGAPAGSLAAAGHGGGHRAGLRSAPVVAGPGGLHRLWRGLHRLHDLCGGPAARAGGGARAHHPVLCLAGGGGAGLGALVGRPAGARARWWRAGLFEWLAGAGGAAAGAERLVAGLAAVGADVWRGVSVGGGVDHGPGAPQPAGLALGGGHQCLHHRVCGGADRGADRRGLDCRRGRRAGAGPGVLGAGAVGGGLAGLAAAPVDPAALAGVCWGLPDRRQCWKPEGPR